MRKSKIFFAFIISLFIPVFAGAASKKDSNDYEFHSTVTVLPKGTDGSAGTGATYVYFGDWPQTIKAPSVTVNEKKSLKMGSSLYYQGDDGFWYAKLLENAGSEKSFYSDDSTASTSASGRSKYFKVEPIKWRVLTKDYNGTGKALLLAEDVLDAMQFYSAFELAESQDPSDLPQRQIDKKTSAYENNYKYSQVHAWLNGVEYYSIEKNKTAKKSDYKGKGFLQITFNSSAQKLLVQTEVNASGEVSKDKVFLLSQSEAAELVNGALNVRNPSDYAVAKGMPMAAYDGVGYYLRTPAADDRTKVSGVEHGSVSSFMVNAGGIGLVPAITVSLSVDGEVKVDSSKVSMADLKKKFEARLNSSKINPSTPVKADAGMFEVKGSTVNKSVRYSEIFTYGRNAAVADFYASDHDTAKTEYEKYCASVAGISSSSSATATWYDAVIYCNLRSIAEGLVPAYYISDNGNKLCDPADWVLIEPSIKSHAQGKYCYSSDTPSAALDKGIKMDMSSDGYRLPTEIEWEYLAVFYGVYGSSPEWCWDWYVGFDEMPENLPVTGIEKIGERVVRGFYHKDFTTERNLVERESYPTTSAAGFRVVRSKPTAAPSAFSVDVTVGSEGAGLAAAKVKTAKPGAVVRLENKENIGWEFDSYTAKDANGKAVKVSSSGSFIMPES
ncbi:MAG: SUMF1/EgtB/PvdO family nonheme iron enzyme, partial [Treponema sp.]|nr:SUMF1/EgtB/PvdO family nonheme iron enzyme [Treponema sp.]